jgi:hypothetical protein
MCHFRDKAGDEVDIVIERSNGAVAGVEVKAPLLDRHATLGFIFDHMHFAAAHQHAMCILESRMPTVLPMEANCIGPA